MSRPRTSRNIRLATHLIWPALVAVLLTGCSQTSAPGPSPSGQGAGAGSPAPAPPPPMQAVAAPSQAPMNGQYEQPPVINATDLLPASALSGPGFQVQQQVPTNGAMGQYTIVADPAVFHDDAGTYYVESLDMLKIRLSEIPAIEALDGMSNSSVFVQALAIQRGPSCDGSRKYGYASDGYRNRTARRSRGPVRPRKSRRITNSFVGIELLRQRRSCCPDRQRHARGVGL